jgi:amidohydrolase
MATNNFQSVNISEILKQKVDDEISRILPEVIAFRHERHLSPELTWQEHETAQAIEQKLRDRLDLKPQVGVGRLGLVAIIEGDKPGPTIALRADMDALPVTEMTGCAYASKTPGVMHACGHDGHMANLFGAALVLKELKAHLHGRVKLIFQPAEEGGGGAEVMCQDGVLSKPDVDAIFGLHGWPELPVGQIFVRSGPMLAATADFKIVISGVGCHAATPHLGTDQVLVAARIIEGLQAIRSRVVAPTDAMVLSVTQIHGGTATNIIPRTVEMSGTLRTVDESVRIKIVNAMERIVSHAAAQLGAEARVELEPNYPATLNHERETDFIEQIAKAVLPAGAVKRMPQPTMGGEDFAYFLNRVPGSYFFLGMDDGRSGGYPSLHHPAYDFNDAALPVGIKMFVHAALAYGSPRSLN